MLKSLDPWCQPHFQALSSCGGFILIYLLTFYVHLQANQLNKFKLHIANFDISNEGLLSES
jgi:hypothetical protein